MMSKNIRVSLCNITRENSLFSQRYKKTAGTDVTGSKKS